MDQWVTSRDPLFNSENRSTGYQRHKHPQSLITTATKLHCLETETHRWEQFGTGRESPA